MALTNGTKLGPYELIAPLGAGLWALPPSQVLQYGAQIAGALDTAHHNGVAFEQDA
jgi:hypothetical protein